jgi:outer membrane biosynthesis protein TonB
MKKLFKGQGSFNSAMIVRVFWGDILYDTVLCESTNPITVGREPGSTFVMDLGRGASVTKLPLLCILPDGTAELCFDKNMEGHIRKDGKIRPLDKIRSAPETEKTSDGLFKIALGPKDTASIVIGYVSFDLSWRGEKFLVPRSIILDKKNTTVAGAIGILMILLLTLVNVTLEDKEDEKPPERIVEIIPPKILKKKVAQAPSQTASQQEAAPPAAVQAQAEPEKPKAPPPPPTAAEKLRSANLSSLVSNLSNLSSTVSAPVVKNRDVASAAPATAAGLSTDTLKTPSKKVGIGKTQGAGEGSYATVGQLGLSGNTTVEGGSGFTIGAPSGEVGSGLDKQVIDQIVRSQQARIRSCYERQLNFSPGLAGKVTVQFTIGDTGQVLKASIIEDTMKNTAVKNCISTEVQSWHFPAPKGGGTVKVDYPFVFESNGGAG